MTFAANTVSVDVIDEKSRTGVYGDGIGGCWYDRHGRLGRLDRLRSIPGFISDALIRSVFLFDASNIDTLSVSRSFERRVPPSPKYPHHHRTYRHCRVFPSRRGYNDKPALQGRKDISFRDQRERTALFWQVGIFSIACIDETELVALRVSAVGCIKIIGILRSKARRTNVDPVVFKSD